MTKSNHKYLTHRKDKYVLPTEIEDPVRRKPAKREEVSKEQDDDNHCHSPCRP